ncbi:MAG: DUF4835 family protein [Prevotella sp.]|nr:DUF4835 family protein [Prevotella sp.]MDY5667176.1 DUF4835 family protein [Alloprevotella sp.]
MTHAQELDARVTINHQQVQGTSTSVFETLKTALEQFLNERQWTNMQFKKNERIACNFAITIKKYSPSDNTFQGSLNVQSTRPVYGATYTTTCYAFNDPNFNFTYQEYDQIDFRQDVIDNNLTAMLAYYVYMIIGYDLDAMAPMGGTESFKTCQTIVTGAQSLSEKGWKAFDDNKNRYALITDLLDGGMEPFRQMQYKYYREGLDVMSENVERGRAAITQALELLNKAHDNKSMSALPQIFTEFKRDELLNIYKGHASSQEKDKVVNILTRINASQSSYWRDI